MRVRANFVTVKMPTATYHHGNLRQALLDEASRVLEDEGVEAISFRALARSLGVSHAAPGHHFADRHALLAALGTLGFETFADALEQAMEGLEEDAWLGAIGKAYVRFALANPELYRLMFTSRLLIEECPPELTLASSRAYLALLTAAYGGPPQGPPETYRLSVLELKAWSVVHGAVMLWLDGQLEAATDEAGFLELADQLVDTV